MVILNYRDAIQNLARDDARELVKGLLIDKVSLRDGALRDF